MSQEAELKKLADAAVAAVTADPRAVLPLLEEVAHLEHDITCSHAREAALRESILAIRKDSDLWDWLSRHQRLELSHGYGDEDDGEGRWQVHEQRGNRNGRECDLIAEGSTPLEAVGAAVSVMEGK